MPEWLWAIVIGGVVAGLIAALRVADQARVMDRIAKLEQWTKDKETFDYAFRHHDYSPTIGKINAQLYPLSVQIAQLEARVTRLDHKVFNGAK